MTCSLHPPPHARSGTEQRGSPSLVSLAYSIPHLPHTNSHHRKLKSETNSQNDSSHQHPHCPKPTSARVQGPWGPAWCSLPLRLGGICVSHLNSQPSQKDLLRSQTWVKISSGPDSTIGSSSTKTPEPWPASSPSRFPVDAKVLL